MPAIRPAGTEELMELAMLMAPRMRVADRLEVWRGSLCSPLAGLQLSIKGTRNGFLLENEGRPEAIGGCSPLHNDPRVGAPWMLGTDFITEHPRWFWRATPEIWATVSPGYSWLWNLVDAQNTTHVRWLRKSGCRFLGTRELNGNPFIEFSKCVSH